MIDVMNNDCPACAGTISIQEVFEKKDSVLDAKLCRPHMRNIWVLENKKD